MVTALLYGASAAAASVPKAGKLSIWNEDIAMVVEKK